MSETKNLTNEDKKALLKENVEVIKHLARLDDISIEEKTEKPEDHVGFVVGGIEVFIDLTGVVDVDKEKIRLETEIKQLSGYVIGLNKKLSNKEFTKNAPKEVVEKEQEKLEEGKVKLGKLEEQLKSLN